MFSIFNKKEKNKPIYRSVNKEIPVFNSWHELYVFLENKNVPLQAKLEIIRDIEVPNVFYSQFSKRKSYPIPDFFWQTESLDRKVRAACRIKSKSFLSVVPEQGSITKKDAYERLVKDASDELFIGLCELSVYPLFTLLDSDLITQEQKETMVKCAIHFKKSYNKQEEYHEYTLIYAYRCSCFSKEFKDKIYEAIKNNMLRTGNYSSQTNEDFFNRFYSDKEVNDEDKTTMINHTFNNVGNNRKHIFMFYLGNPNIPSFIQRIVLNHFAAEARNKENDTILFQNFDTSSYINTLLDVQIPYELKEKLIEATTNPVLLCYGIGLEDIDENIAQLLTTRLTNLVSGESIKVLEMMKALLKSPDISKKRLLIAQEQDQ